MTPCGLTGRDQDISRLFGDGLLAFKLMTGDGFDSLVRAYAISDCAPVAFPASCFSITVVTYIAYGVYGLQLGMYVTTGLYLNFPISLPSSSGSLRHFSVLSLHEAVSFVDKLSKTVNFAGSSSKSMFHVLPPQTSIPSYLEI